MRSPRIGNSVEDAVDPRRVLASRRCAARDRGDAQVVGDVELREDARAAAELHDALPEPQLRLDVGERATVQAHDAAVGDAEPADGAQHRRLAGAVRAEQREHFALAALRSRRRTAPAPGRSCSRGCAPATRGSRVRSALRRFISSCSSSNSSTASEMSRFMKRAPYTNSTPPTALAIGMTIVSAVREPCASESAPVMRPPKKPPIKKMNTGMIAKACARSRYGATAPMIGPIPTNAAPVHALASAMKPMSSAIGVHPEPDHHEQPEAEDQHPRRCARPARGRVRNARS